jgi:hypothetical protein
VSDQKITELTALTAVAPTDLLVVVDDPSGTPVSKKATVADVVAAVVSAYLQYRDQKAQNTAGGTFTSGAWQTRTLNTEVSDAGGHGTLASNQITLAAGTYLVRASAPGWFCTQHQARLQNITDTATLLVGTCEYSASSTGAQTRSEVHGQFTLASAKVIELQHQCQTTKATDGFGVPSNFTTEVYAVVELWKIA